MKADPMHYVHTYAVNVEFGDCDPAQIVHFPNYYRWIDAASRNFFARCGVPAWRELEPATGVIGTPLVDTHARFLRTASYGDRLEVDTEVMEWRGKSFVMRHRIRRGDVLLVECEEVRIFAARAGADPHLIRAVPVPADIRARCGEGVVGQVAAS